MAVDFEILFPVSPNRADVRVYIWFFPKCLVFLLIRGLDKVKIVEMVVVQSKYLNHSELR